MIKDGSQVKLWEDSWLGNSPLRDQYPQLYNIVRKKQDTVADVLSTQIPNVFQRRDLIGNKLVMWNNLVSRLSTIVLNQERDDFKWNLDQTGVFLVKSHYLGLINQNISNLNKRIQKLKAPLKIKFFLQYLRRDVIHTKIILQNVIGRGTNSIVSIMKMKQYNIYFSTADSQKWYGLRSMRPGV